MKLSEIIDGLEMTSDIVDSYYNPKTGNIFLSNIGDFEDLNEDELDDLFRESIILPSRYEINEYQMMKNFIESVEDSLLYNKLLIAINGKGAFRRFKDTCINLGIIDDWYKYRDQKYKVIAINWCLNNNLEYVDDLKY